ncbi:VIT1/CCC1 transporter family protein [Pseudomonas sp. FP2196]|uniref:VIT1/CCC1 transporter family protein n=1 Tax=Pseudomonas sp. FP2196 TaxID=2954086 RepID=UPI0027358EE4|nr:VIT1/CCC1 transporter family protein [Pseudomonas sp. FP2196]WLH38255.1 VIT1/CCC1 transporter family protein [Pseudomonas sp. FP2196]
MAIEKPCRGVREVMGVMELSDAAIATSGDYRQWVDIGGQTYAHTMNPVTGAPLRNSLTAVSVVAASCMLADAWATALLVLGEIEGPRLAQKRGMDAFTERADLARERAELANDPKAEHIELANIYIQRGVSPELAHQVADQLMAHDALGSHARDELGISETLTAKPLQAALASAASFVVGAALPLAVTFIAPTDSVVPWICGMSLVFLGSLGAVAARAGGASVVIGAWRVTLWGVLAMGITALVGSLFGAVV